MADSPLRANTTHSHNNADTEIEEESIDIPLGDSPLGDSPLGDRATSGLVTQFENSLFVRIDANGGTRIFSDPNDLVRELTEERESLLTEEQEPLLTEERASVGTRNARVTRALLAFGEPSVPSPTFRTLFPGIPFRFLRFLFRILCRLYMLLVSSLWQTAGLVTNLFLRSAPTNLNTPHPPPPAPASDSSANNASESSSGQTPTLTPTTGHVPTAAEESMLSASVFGPLNISRLLVKKGSDVEALLVGAGVRSNDFVLGAAFDRDLITSGVIVEEAHILTRQELQVDGQTRSDLLDKLGLLLSPHRALISTPSNQYYSTSYLHGQRCAYEHLIELHISQQLEHDYEDLVLASLVDQEESGANPTGSSGVEFSRDSPAGNGSQREDEDPDGHGSSGPPDDSSHERGGGEGGDDGDDGDDGEGEGLNVTQERVHFKVLFKVRSDTGKSNFQTIRVEGSLSSKDSADVLLPHDMISACHFQFLELDFEGKSDYGAKRAHQQFYANVNIDVGERPFHVGDPQPKSTPSQSNTIEQVQVQESSKGVQANGALKSLGPLPSADISAGGSRTTKQGSSQKILVNMNRITQGQTETGAHWGYRVDDPGTAENGLRLTGNPSDLPSATFTFLGKKKGLAPPKDLKVKIDSYWTIPDAAIRADWPQWATWFQLVRQPILRDLGVRVTFNMAPHLRGSWTLQREVTVGAMGVKDTYLYGIDDPSEVEFSTPSFTVAERARQDPHRYAMEE